MGFGISSFLPLDSSVLWLNYLQKIFRSSEVQLSQSYLRPQLMSLTCLQTVRPHHIPQTGHASALQALKLWKQLFTEMSPCLTGAQGSTGFSSSALTFSIL